jgi:hypothetical protein
MFWTAWDSMMFLHVALTQSSEPANHKDALASQALMGSILDSTQCREFSSNLPFRLL